MQRFPSLKIAYLEGGGPYGALIEDGGAKETRIDFPTQFFFGQGKPVNQNNIIKFVRGEIIQFMDMNQDMYLEETFKGPCLMEEFRRNPRVDIVGYPEDIVTDISTPVGKYHAFADRTFNTLVQRQLDWILGNNPFSASTVEGIGHSHPLQFVNTVEFFPPTPRLPGAVMNGLGGTIDDQPFMGDGIYHVSEYWTPMVAYTVWLMAELQRDDKGET